MMVFLNIVLLILCIDTEWILPAPVDFTIDKCLEVASFTPRACDMPEYQQKCWSYCKSSSMLKCGVKNKKVVVDGKSRKRRIVGGIDSKMGQWPWHVSLSCPNRTTGVLTQWCGGSILSNNYILTAAHCFDPTYTSVNAKDWTVKVGDHLLSTQDHKETSHSVKRIHSHPALKCKTYMKDVLVVCSNDIAIIELEQPLKNVRGICLPYHGQSIPPKCSIMGWGHLKYEGKQPEVLQEAGVPIVSIEQCNSPLVYNATIDPYQSICAGYASGVIDACHYDSGGSLACETNNTWYATGLVSSGYECGRPLAYGLYTNVSSHVNWIVEAILK